MHQLAATPSLSVGCFAELLNVSRSVSFYLHIELKQKTANVLNCKTGEKQIASQQLTNNDQQRVYIQERRRRLNDNEDE